MRRNKNVSKKYLMDLYSILAMSIFIMKASIVKVGIKIKAIIEKS